MNRDQILLANIKKNHKGLEIGPSFRPLVRKKDGYNVKIVDHASAEDLIKKYQSHGIDLGQIEEVDFICNGQRLSELLNGQQFDYILASHVVEHVPDFISFMQDCESLLLENGSLRLAIPDKRYCFDFSRECSSLGRIIDIFEMKPQRQTIGSAAEYFLTVCKKNGLIAWDKETKGSIVNVHSFAEACEAIETTKKGGYLDIHNWVFTPESFQSIIFQLNKLKYFQLSISSFHDTIGCEFFVILKK